MEQVLTYVKPLKDFSKDSMRLVKRCTKPDLKGRSFIRQLVSCGIGYIPGLLFCLQSFRRLRWLLWWGLLLWDLLDSLSS